MNNASPAGVSPSSFPPCNRRGLAPNPAQCIKRPLPGAALSAVLLCDFDALDGSLLFGSTQSGEALVMRRDDEFGLLIGLALAIPAGLGMWALIVGAIISFQR